MNVDVVVDELLRAQNDAAEAAALAVDVLGGRVDDAVGAELQRALPERRREYVVDHHGRAGRMRDLAHLRDVDDLEGRVGRRFHEHGLGVRPHRGAPLIKIGAVDDSGRNAVAGQVLLHHVKTGAEQRLGGDHMVAGAHLSHQRERDRGHSGCGGARGLGALELRNTLLEHRNSRIGEPRVLVAGVFALEAGFCLRRIFVDIALGQKQRFRGLAELRAQCAGVHQTGFRAVLHSRRRGHRGPPWPTKNRPGKNPWPGTRVPGLLANYFTWLASRPAQMTTG